jgi:hypothetical protein
MVLMVFFSSRISPRGHVVDAVGETTPGSRHAFDFRLSAELSFSSYFPSHARHFGSERAELIHHRIDGIFQLQNFAAHQHRDLAREIAFGDGRGDFGNIADLCRKIAGH